MPKTIRRRGRRLPEENGAMSNHEKKKRPFFSVVIPTYERPDDLRQCLNGLKADKQPQSPPYEIIVTDDSRSDSARILVEKEFPNVSWGKGKQNGPAGNRNAGVERAKGDWIVFIDDDCIAQPDFLSAYARAIKRDCDTLIFEGRIFTDRPRKTWAEGSPENEKGGMFWTSNLCVNKETFFDLGKFDERFQIAYEDVDFAYRIKRKKLKTKFIYDASVCHPWRSLKGKKNWKRNGYEIESLLIFLKKHPSSVPEYGNPKVFLRNIFRMLTHDAFVCIFKLKGRGINELVRQFIVSISLCSILAAKSFKND